MRPGLRRAVILSVDVHYDDRADEARAAGIAFIQWTDAKPEHSFTRSHRGVAPYQ
jgi:hypothetical protein